MVELSKESVDFQVLMSYPGIGETTAVRIIGELGDIRRFKNPKQINAYAGIDIQRHQSGKLQYQDRINKRGNRRLRKILYFMVMSMISLRAKTKNTIVDYYDQLKKQPQGKPHKVAVIACVNKFPKVAFHLFNMTSCIITNQQKLRNRISHYSTKTLRKNNIRRSIWHAHFINSCTCCLSAGTDSCGNSMSLETPQGARLSRPRRLKPCPRKASAGTESNSL